MNDSIQINIDFGPELKQVIMKLANTYKPSFELNEITYKDQIELFKDVSQKTCDDFSMQLRPLLFEALNQKFDKQVL